MQNAQQADYSKMSDEALVGLAQTGDSNAFAVLIGRHYAASRRLAASILQHKHDADDEVQNACWKAYEHIRQFQSDAKFSTWLTRIVVNQCLMKMRRTMRSRLVYVEDLAADGSHAYDLPAQMDTPEDAVAKSQIAEVLDHEIKRIPPLLRNVFLLRDVEERPMEEVAGELGISVAAAKSRLLRARAELRSRLARHQGRLGPATLMA